MLKLKLQHFGHLMGRTNSLEKTLMLGKMKAGGEGDTPTVGRPAAGERPGLVSMAFRFGRRVKYNEVVTPHTKALGSVCGQFEFTMPENSIGILRLKPIH